jgi:hypothetical protein
MFRNFFFCCVLRSNRTLWHVDVVVHFEKTLRKKKKNVSRAGNTQKTHGLHSHLKICTFLHFSSSTLFLVYFSVFLITFYNFPSSFSCCWEKKNSFFFLSHLHVVHERVYLLLKGGFRSFLKYAHAISHVVCVIIRNTHSHTHTHTTWTGKWRETHLNYTYIIYLCTFFPIFFLNRFIIISMMNYKRWPPFIETRVFWVCLFISPFP